MKEDNFMFATVAAKYTDGVTLIFPGQTEASAKHYKCNAATQIRPGDLVKVIKDSGTYVVEYPLGAPARLYNMNKCPTNASNETLANWINTIINALYELKLMNKNNW